MPYLSESNEKYASLNVQVVTFTLPAFKAVPLINGTKVIGHHPPTKKHPEGPPIYEKVPRIVKGWDMDRIICPGAFMCAHGCYGREGNFKTYYYSSKTGGVLRQHKCLELVASGRLVPVISGELEALTKRKTPRGMRTSAGGGLDFCRVHDVGDYFSKEYLYQWYEIMRKFPLVNFWSYTKSVGFFKTGVNEYTPAFRERPANFNIVFSEGGWYDHLINREKDRYSRVFKTFEAMNNAPEGAYADGCSTDMADIEACYGENNRVGLVFHPPSAPLKFTTDPREPDYLLAVKREQEWWNNFEREQGHFNPRRTYQPIPRGVRSAGKFPRFPVRKSVR